MGFINDGICYIPELVNDKMGKVDSYQFLDNNMGLNLLLEHTSESIAELLKQYPMALLLEEIHKLEDKEYKKLKNFGGDADCYYHYSHKSAGSLQGISIHSLDNLESSGIFSMKITTNIGNNYQRRIQLFYDGLEEYFVPHSVIETSKNNGFVMQSSFSPKVLRKVKKYIKY